MFLKATDVLFKLLEKERPLLISSENLAQTALPPNSLGILTHLNKDNMLPS